MFKIIVESSIYAQYYTHSVVLWRVGVTESNDCEMIRYLACKHDAKTPIAEWDTNTVNNQNTKIPA